MATRAEMRDDRAFVNPYPGEIGKDEAHILDAEKKKLSTKYLGKALENIKILLHTWETGIARQEAQTDYSVYTGSTGNAMLYLRLYDHHKDEKYLMKAADVLNPVLKKLKGRRGTFLTGDGGPLALCARIYSKINNKDKSDKCISQLFSFHKDMVTQDSDEEDEVLYGRAGYLYSLLFLRHKKDGLDMVPAHMVREVVSTMITRGQQTARKVGSSSPLMYYWHDKGYLGAAHGLIGIMFMLLQAREFLTPDELQREVRGTINYICGLQQPSGNIPSSLSNPSDRLVHWCHGAPGAVFLFAKAFEVYEDEMYLNYAKKAGECVWERGLLHKGYGLCHGSSGNGYALLYLHQITGDAKYLYRAAQFGRWCQDFGTHGCRQPDRPLSLYEGLAGDIYFLLDLLQPEYAKFPGFVI